MPTDIETKAVTAAQSDWDNQKSYYLVCGDLWSPGPILNLELGFYRCVYNYWASEEDEVFCHYYNQEVQWLLSEHGTPNWAPITRLTFRHESLEFLKNGVEWKEYK